MPEQKIAELTSLIQKLQKENKRLKKENQKLKRVSNNYEDLYRATNEWLNQLGKGSEQLLKDLRRTLNGFLQRIKTSDMPQEKLRNDTRDFLVIALNKLNEYEQRTPLSFLELYP